MKIKNMFEYLLNCSRKNLGKNVEYPYFAVVILFETWALPEVVDEFEMDGDDDPGTCDS